MLALWLTDMYDGGSVVTICVLGLIGGLLASYSVDRLVGGLICMVMREALLSMYCLQTRAQWHQYFSDIRLVVDGHSRYVIYNFKASDGHNCFLARLLKDINTVCRDLSTLMFCG